MVPGRGVYPRHCHKASQASHFLGVCKPLQSRTDSEPSAPSPPPIARSAKPELSSGQYSDAPRVLSFPAPMHPGLVAHLADRAAAAETVAEARLAQLGLEPGDASKFLDEIRAVIDTHIAFRTVEMRALGRSATCSSNHACGD